MRWRYFDETFDSWVHVDHMTCCAVIAEYEYAQQIFLQDQLRLSNETNRELLRQLHTLGCLNRNILLASLPYITHQCDIPGIFCLNYCFFNHFHIHFHAYITYITYMLLSHLIWFILIVENNETLFNSNIQTDIVPSSSSNEAVFLHNESIMNSTVRSNDDSSVVLQTNSNTVEPVSSQSIEDREPENDSNSLSIELPDLDNDSNSLSIEHHESENNSNSQSNLKNIVRGGKSVPKGYGIAGRPFICEELSFENSGLCLWTFTQKAHLKRHQMRFHAAGDNVYECSYCRRIFSTIENIQKHLKNKHQK